jgi:CxxC motif-containing protein (DUF1111 family)
MYYARLFALGLIPLVISCSGGGDSSPTSSETELSTSTPELPIFQANERFGAGEATVPIQTSEAFSRHSANMTETSDILKFNLGNDFFENPWVAGSASTSSRDGLGGLFNNNACQDCHIRDGRGHAPSDGSSDFSSILFRATRSQLSSDELAAMQQSLMANVGDNYAGGQIQQDAVANVSPEAELGVTYTTEERQFSDGYTVELRRPQWLFTSLDTERDFNLDTVFSARVAPQMIGLGLLNLISEQEILANRDNQLAEGGPISGKANYVWSIEQQSVQLGRFGWKAGQPSLLEQAAGAFVNDMGLTNRLHPTENCQDHQTDCLNAPNGNGDSTADYDYEVADKILDAIDFYSSHLGVPERRQPDAAQVKQGKSLFFQAGCHSCHVESYITTSSTSLPKLSNQKIYPYTDLLLHDMGSDLADFMRNGEAAAEDLPVEFLATSHEWRTPPLWGIGLAKTVDPEATFLHDGRARTILEAILWHGGEAKPARDTVLTFNQQQRDDLLAFLNDL